MTATATIPAVLDALRAVLIARPGLAGVEVLTADFGPDRPPRAITLGVGTTDVTQTWVKLGDFAKDEQVDGLPCAIRVVEPGAGETAIKASRDAAYTIFAEVELAVRADPTLGGILPSLPLTIDGYAHAAGVADTGRVTVIAFTLSWRARLTA